MRTKSEIVDKIDLKTVYIEPIPTIYCDGFKGVTFSGNVVKMNLIEEKTPPDEKEMYRKVIANLVMPTEVFFSFVEVLNAIKEEATAQLSKGKGDASKDKV